MVKVDKTYDMDMPQACGDCKMWHVGLVSGDFKCCFTHQDISWDVRDGKRNDMCPLKEVEESEEENG